MKFLVLFLFCFSVSANVVHENAVTIVDKLIAKSKIVPSQRDYAVKLMEDRIIECREKLGERFCTPKVFIKVSKSKFIPHSRYRDTGGGPINGGAVFRDISLGAAGSVIGTAIYDNLLGYLWEVFEKCRDSYKLAQEKAKEKAAQIRRAREREARRAAARPAPPNPARRRSSGGRRGGGIL